jgi:hypothetical protein
MVAASSTRAEGRQCDCLIDVYFVHDKPPSVHPVEGLTEVHAGFDRLSPNGVLSRFLKISTAGFSLDRCTHQYRRARRRKQVFQWVPAQQVQGLQHGMVSDL